MIFATGELDQSVKDFKRVQENPLPSFMCFWASYINFSNRKQVITEKNNKLIIK